MVGPSMRLALLLPTSKDIASPMRAGPTTWPISIRRTGLSAAQAMPLMKLASARCQTASMPAMASAASAAEVSRLTSTMAVSALRGCTRSASTPIGAPNSPIGRIRSMPIMATRKAEPVACQTKIETASISSQRTMKTTSPMPQSRRKSG